MASMDYAAEMTAWMDQGRTEEAMASIRDRMEMCPHDDLLFYLMGNAYRRFSDWQHALECYAQAVDLNPQSPARNAQEMIQRILEYRCKALLNP